MRLRRLFGRGDEPDEGDDQIDDEVDPDEADEAVDADVDADDADELEAVALGEAGDDETYDDESSEGDGDDAAEGDAPDGDASDGDASEDEADELEAAAVGEAGDDESYDDDAPDPNDQILFELAEWGARERRLIDAELESMGVRRAWEASTLVVAAPDAHVVDDLIDEIEERVALDLPSDVEPVIYDVSDWPQGLEERLVDALIDERIPHLRSYREIRVGRDDEERVDGLVETVTTAWEDEIPTDEELEGPDAQQVLSELFVASDRLLHDPSDAAATVRFDDAASDSTTMGVPFGFSDADWTAINDLVEALRDLLGAEEADDDDIVEAATALRTHLRPIV